jgi:acyl-CoA synthetase (AMP-forming)/AMP-acid ligase II
MLVLPSEEPTARLVLGTLLLGAVPLLIAPPALTGPNSNLTRVIEHTMALTKAKLVIAADPLPVDIQAARQLQAAPLTVDGTADPVPPNLPEEAALAALQLTSGTTGLPRVCTWDHRAVLAALAGMRQAMALSSEDVCFNWTPLYHDMGLVNNFLLCLTEGVPLAMMSPHEFAADPSRWLKGLSDSGATMTWSPNFGYALAAQRARDEALEGVRLDGVRAFWNAAERIHLSTILAFTERFAPYGVRLDAMKTNFGCAENVGGATFSDPAGSFVVEHLDPDLFADGKAVPTDSDARSVPVVGVGRPYPGMTVAIRSSDGQTLPDGVIGEIVLDSPSRMNGYLGDPDATNQALRGEMLRTSDLGYTRDGEVFWVGRVKERINVSGKKYDPSDFEATLMTVPSLRPGRFAAFGVDDDRDGTQRLVIVAEVIEPLTRSLEEVRREIRRKIFLDIGVNVGEVLLVSSGSLAKTSSGKRRHNHYQTMYQEGALRPFELSAGVTQ